ncbi:MAG: hypothetical protein COB85_03090 [Bacteroidetes bacterium]|nr:MAG: hypothetical protein COB85_03090 [Bacteroidota bacterium]
MNKQTPKQLPRLVDEDIVTTNRPRVVSRRSNRRFVTVAIALGITAVATVTSCRKADSKSLCDSNDYTSYSDSWDGYDASSYADSNYCDTDDRRLI